MKEINEMIVTIAKKKAEAAREAAEAVKINEIEFKAGIMQSEIQLESGAKELCELVGGTFHEGYYFRYEERWVTRVRWFKYDEVRFFEERTIHAEEVPEGAEIAESLEKMRYESEEKENA